MLGRRGAIEQVYTRGLPGIEPLNIHGLRPRHSVLRDEAPGVLCRVQSDWGVERAASLHELRVLKLVYIVFQPHTLLLVETVLLRDLLGNYECIC